MNTATNRPKTQRIESGYGVMVKVSSNRLLNKIQPPVCLRLELSDGTKLDSDRRYIMVGRREDGNQEQIDIDFSQLGGREHGVSRCHSIVRIGRDGVFVQDFNSRNGTFLNGYELHPMQEYSLSDGDELVFGRVRAKIHFIY